MSQIGPGQNPYGPAPMGPQQGGYPQPVVYRPGVPNVPMAGYGPADAYRPGMPPRGPMMAGAPGQPVAEKPKEYIAQKDVAFGIAGAVGGYFLAGMVGLSGPMGALILGIALLAISAGMRAFKKNDAPQQPINNQMPRPPVYPQPGQQQPMYQNRYNYQNEQMPGQPPRYPQ